MAEFTDREHYIPLRKGELIELLRSDKGLSAEEHDPFKRFCTLIGAVFHFEYLERLERLKEAYAPFDPDWSAPPLKPPRPEQRETHLEQAFSEFRSLMERANFKRLSEDDVRAAVEGGASDWGLNMDVDFAVFERLEVYARGEGKSKRTKRHPILFWKKTEKEVDTYARLVLMLKLRPHKRLGDNIDTRNVFLKLFKDIPKLDLEMVMPGARIQMPALTRYKLGGSLFSSIGYALYSVGWQIVTAVKTLLGFSVAAASAALSALWGPAVLLAGYGYKQYYSYQVTKQTYSKMLTESLYYQTLGNNSSVMTHILDEAEEQEFREAVLAYYCLWRFAPPQGWSSEQLDDYVEMYLEGNANLKVDFEIGDALEKVVRLGAVEQDGNMYRAVPIATALERLDYRWDNYFQYNQSGVTNTI
jgi:Protein of unknown function (DUF3754)